jgi:PIN domain nuclease of toxin-antitoxin system
VGRGDVKVLLDTHTFIWMDTDPSKLSGIAAAVIQDRSNTLLLSTVCIWEIVIKVGLGKWTLTRPLDDIVKDQRQANDVRILPVRLAHAYAVGSLPIPHRDPFDRMLAAQAIVEGADLLTADPIFTLYPVRVVW